MMKRLLLRLKKNQNKRGFTLVEIIVVLVILAILAAIAVPAVLGYVEDARKAQYISEARSIYTVVKTEETKYKAEKGYDNNDASFDFEKFALDTTLFTMVNGSPDGKEGIIEQKTGFTNTMVYYAPGVYAIGWTNKDNHSITAWVYENKKIEIETIDGKNVN